VSLVKTQKFLLQFRIFPFQLRDELHGFSRTPAKRISLAREKKKLAWDVVVCVRSGRMHEA
jgi:hypothetical protein